MKSSGPRPPTASGPSSAAPSSTRCSPSSSTPSSRAPHPTTRWDASERGLLLEIGERYCNDAEREGLTGRPLLWKLDRRRILRELEGFLDTDEEIRAELGVVPRDHGRELAFGFGGDSGDPAVVTLADGRVVRFHGYIDRVDEASERIARRRLRLQDGLASTIPPEASSAATGSSSPCTRWRWPVTTRRPRCAAYYWSTRGVRHRRARRASSSTTRRNEQFVDKVSTIVDGIGAGVFPAFPDKPRQDGRGRETWENCCYCPFDRVCAPARDDDWTRKRGDPVVARFRDLADPPAGRERGRVTPVDRRRPRRRSATTTTPRSSSKPGRAPGRPPRSSTGSSRLIARGRVTIRELAAITFTEAAAGELRDRIRYRLERAAARSNRPGAGAGRARALPAALEDVDDAALTTLHGFAQRILAEHPLEAGLPPRFEVVDDVEAAVRFDERWGQFLDALVADPELEPVLLPALALGIDFDHLRRVARVLHDHYERLRPASAAAIAPRPRSTWLRSSRLSSRRPSAWRSAGSGRTSSSSTSTGSRAGSTSCAAADDDLDRLDLLGQMPKLTTTKGRHENWRCRGRRRARAARAGGEGASCGRALLSSRRPSTC